MSQFQVIFSEIKTITDNVFLNIPPIISQSGLPGADAHMPKLSFSAALTNPMVNAGTIVFDKVFVNEGEFYNPRTGDYNTESH